MCDIYKMVAKLLEKDGKRVASIRTVQRALRMLNDELGLIQTKFEKIRKR
ncbi:plasmid maintenance protein (plasmid) [Borreliella sinica]